MRRNSRNFNSPYAKPLHQEYPSQSEDYLAFNIGGSNLDQRYNSNRFSHESEGRKSFGRGRIGFGGRSFPHQRNNVNQGQDNAHNSSQLYDRVEESVPLFYRDNTSSGQRDGGNSSYNSYNQRRNCNKYNRNSFSSPAGIYIAHQNNQHRQVYNPVDYIHSSMLEDPWMDLMERLQALQQSEIRITKGESSCSDNEAINTND